MRCVFLLLALGLSASADVLALRVSRSFPIVGQAIDLNVRGLDGAALPEGAGVLFRVRPEAGGAEWTRETLVSEGRASVRWAPTETGPYRVVAEVAGEALEPVSVFAASRRLHFSYWACPLEQRFATAVMENDPAPERAELRLDRGVLPLQWKPGAIPGHELPEEWVADYTNLLPSRVGATIDEFWGSGEPPHLDEPACLGLIGARDRMPDIFLAPYCMSVGRGTVRRAFAQSDLLQLELYRRDYRSYGSFGDALAQFARAGLADRTIPILAAGPGNAIWATTEEEVARQIQSVRWQSPETPGVGFFPEFFPGLAEAADRAIAEWFLGPVVQLRGETVRNVGETVARDVRVAQEGGTEKLIARLEPWAWAKVPEARAVLPGEGYRVLEEPKLTGLAPEASLVASLSEAADAAAAIDLSALTVETAVSDDPDISGQPASATEPLPRPAGEGSLTLSFELTLTHCYFYGSIGVSLRGEGPGGLEVSLGHNDHDADISPREAHVEFVARNAEGLPVADVCPVGLRVGASYRIVVARDGASRVRFGVFELTEGAARPIWAVEHAHAGAIPVDRVRLDVRPWLGSALEPTAEGVHLRGVSGGEKPSPYVLEGTLRDLRVGASR